MRVFRIIGAEAWGWGGGGVGGRGESACWSV